MTAKIEISDRQSVDYLADIYGNIVAMEQLEKAYRRDLVTADYYSSTIRRLIEKHRSTVGYLATSHNPYFTSEDAFLEEYCKRFPAARELIKKGPATTAAENNSRFLARQSMECGQLFITLLDALRLNQTSVDSLNPLLPELVLGLRKLKLGDKEFVVRLQGWKDKLDSMSAADTLNETSAREFAYDLERGYNCLREYLDDDATHTKR